MIKKIILFALVVYFVNTSDCSSASLTEDSSNAPQCMTDLTPSEGNYCCFTTFRPNEDAGGHDSYKCLEVPKTHLDSYKGDSEKLGEILEKELIDMDKTTWPEAESVEIECQLEGADIARGFGDLIKLNCEGIKNPNVTSCIYDIDSQNKCCYSEKDSEKSCKFLSLEQIEGRKEPFDLEGSTVTCFKKEATSSNSSASNSNESSTTNKKESGAAFLKIVAAFICLFALL